ncbi:MAG: ABC transporter substrate-binding protein, partial [Trebonia sp.]
APGGTARVALPAGVTLNDIWPYTPPARAGQGNARYLQRLLYRPLYLFGGNGPSVTVNYPLSPASAPVYSNGGTTVTITMRGWKWSDGETVDAGDVIFWLNLMKARPDGFYGYLPGMLPDNLASYRATGPGTVVIRLKSPVSDIWFTDNQLAEITPMPAAWDVTSVGARPGSGGCATDTAADRWARCDAVDRFLTAQARNVTAYAASPVWGVVDGPWKLSAFSPAATGPVAAFVPNAAYSGSQHPRLAALRYYAYPDGAAEYAALSAGRLDVGHIPQRYLPPASGGQALPPTNPLGSAFTLSAAYRYGISYLQLNYRNRALGPAFRQLYLRQAMQELIDQAGLAASVDRGYGYPTSGGVPARPSSPWRPAVQESNGGTGPYPYSVWNATATLASHGWKNVGGVLTCESPGAGTARCGPGVAAGTRLSMSLDYPAGDTAFQREAAIIEADMRQAGIQLTGVSRRPGTAGGGPASCGRAAAGCPWGLLGPGRLTFDGPGFEPTGAALFATGGASNAGGYSDPVMDGYLGLVRTSGSAETFHMYARYVADQVPCLWLPNGYAVTATSSRLANAGDSPPGELLPEYWYFTRLATLGHPERLLVTLVATGETTTSA